MKRLDLVNKKFNKLLVTGLNSIRKGNSVWDCKCDCGKSSVVSASDLKSGRIVSCGCYWYNLIKTRVSPSKGRKMSDATKKLMGERHKGKSYPGWKMPQHAIDKMKLIIGEKKASWKGGISYQKYPREFNRELKLLVRKRDGFICCLCKKTEEEELCKLNRVLSVNHIDYNKKNCSINNLNTLCVSCNAKVNKDRDKWTNYFKKQLCQ